MAEMLPAADVSNTGSFTSTGAALWTEIDEPVVDLDDYIDSPLDPADAECRVTLAAVPFPNSTAAHTLRVWVEKPVTGGARIDCTIFGVRRTDSTPLFQGSFPDIPEDPVELTHVLSTAEKSNLTQSDYEGTGVAGESDIDLIIRFNQV